MFFTLYSDEYFMNEALKEARKAYDENEVPVGAVIVSNTQIIARAHNMTEQLKDVTAHAEMLAITAAENHLGGKYLDDCTLYVCLEPCLMCGSAMNWAKLGKLVYGASDPKAGFSLCGGPVLHPKTEVLSAVLKQECGELITRFFKEKREMP